MRCIRAEVTFRRVSPRNVIVKNLVLTRCDPDWQEMSPGLRQMASASPTKGMLGWPCSLFMDVTMASPRPGCLPGEWRT